MDKILNEIAIIIADYQGGQWQSADNLRENLRELSCNHYYLTGFNIKAAEEWNAIVYKYDGSDAASQRFANLHCPELRKSRKILIAVSKVLDSMRSEIGILRQEG